MNIAAFLIRWSLVLPMLALLPHTQAKTFPAGADHFADAPAIDVRSGMSAPTDMSGFSLEAGERPDEPWESPRKTAWWRWTAPSSGFCKVECFHMPGGFRSVQHEMTIWQGESVEAMQPVRTNYGTGLRLQAKNWLTGTSFQAVKGETYRIAADLGNYWSEDPFKIQVRLMLSPSKRMLNGLWRLADAGGNTVDLGQVTLALADNRRFTGKLTLLAGTRGFTGQFDEEGLATVTLKRTALGAGETTLRLDVSGDGVFSLERDGLMAAGKLTERALFKPYFGYPQYRTFACVYENAESGQTGAGRLFMEVGKLGAVKGVGMGLDGDAFTFATGLMVSETMSEYEVTIHARIRGKKGAVQMTVKNFVPYGYPTHVVQGHFFRAPDPRADFYPDGIDLQVGGHGSIAPMQSHNPAGSALLTDFEDGRVLVVNEAQDGLAPGPILAAVNLTGGGPGMFIFAPHPQKPVLKGQWKKAMVKGSITDASGKRRPVTLTLTYDGPSELNRLTGLVRGLTRTHKAELLPPDRLQD
ncbi:hypothetical protein WJU23_01940 [Prosthecobacter sp. SYSU 5D2]|uniref:hypothetical protein n=1 Tax=Prosthecobacter sp. SYSU 5D2 TaxID=3134134 RepID=UPI0031FEA941